VKQKDTFMLFASHLVQCLNFDLDIVRGSYFADSSAAIVL